MVGWGRIPVRLLVDPPYYRHRHLSSYHPANKKKNKTKQNKTKPMKERNSIRGQVLNKGNNKTIVKFVLSEMSACPCLVPRLHYLASINYFGSRDPGRRVRPRQNTENWDNLFQFFTQPISSRARILWAFLVEWQLEKSNLDSPAFVITISQHHWVRNIATFKPQANTIYTTYFNRWRVFFFSHVAVAHDNTFFFSKFRVQLE